MTGFYKLAIGVMRFLMPVWYHIETEGLENVPQNGGYLFISNHRSNADPILIGIQNPDTQFCFLAKQELFADGIVGWVLRKLGAVAVDRGSGDISPLEEIMTRLENGENALIFPEGTRSADGKLGRFKSGAALIACQTGVPIVPVAIYFEDRLRFRSCISVRYGKPFEIPSMDPENPSGSVLKNIRKAMTEQVSALLPEATAAARIPAKPAAALPDAAMETTTPEIKKSEDREVAMSKNKRNQNGGMKPENPTPEKELRAGAEDLETVETILGGEADPPAEKKYGSVEKKPYSGPPAKKASPFKMKNPFRKFLDGDDFPEPPDEEESATAPLPPAEPVSDELEPVLEYDGEEPVEEPVEEAPEDSFDEGYADAEPYDDAANEVYTEPADDEPVDVPSVGGFRLRNPFAKKPAAEVDEEYAEEDEGYFENEEDEVVAAKGFDYGKIALILTFVILGIFAVDFIARLYRDVKGLNGDLNIQTGESSVVDSMNPQETEEQPAITTESTAPAVITDKVQASTSVTILTTTMPDDSTDSTKPETTVNRTGDTVSVSNEDVKKGSLILVDNAHLLQSFPNVVKFNAIEGFREKSHLRLVSAENVIDSSMTQPLLSWFGDFYNATGMGNVMIYATTQDPAYPPYNVSVPERATGLTLDLSILSNDGNSHAPFTADGNYSWVLEHAADYGFIQRYPNDKVDKTGVNGLSWHFRYVGAPHAAYMKANSLCLEEYLETVRSHTWKGEHLTSTAAGINYEIYFVPASETTAETQIPYPAGATPIISGNNDDGFVVAVVKE